MTVIAGFAIKGVCGYLGSESLLTRGSDVVSDADTKILSYACSDGSRVGVGVCGMQRLYNIIRRYLTVEIDDSLSSFDNVYNIVEDIRKIFKEHYEVDFENNSDDFIHCLIMLGDELFLITGNFAIIAIESGKYYAIGIGQDYALGAMYHYYDMFYAGHDDSDTFSRELLNAGIEAAMEFSTGCGGSIDIVKIG